MNKGDICPHSHTVIIYYEDNPVVCGIIVIIKNKKYIGLTQCFRFVPARKPSKILMADNYLFYA